MKTTLLFLASFLVVFLLGLQQLNIQHRRYLWSMVTSVGIALSNYALFKLLPTGDFDIVQFLSYSSGGATGIISAMWIHDHFCHNSTIPIFGGRNSDTI